MSIEHQLARITARTLCLELSSGGHAVLTRDDIKAALGFAEYARKHPPASISKRGKKIKNPLKASGRIPHMGIRIVLAKYTDCSISKRELEDMLAQAAFHKWWTAGDSDHVMISRALMKKIARLMVMDMCHPQQVRLHAAQGIEKMTGLNEEEWRHFKVLYAVAMKACQDMEADVLNHLRSAIN